MKADGTSARQVTCGKAGARQPVYQSTVYTITPTNVEPWVQVAFVGGEPRGAERGRRRAEHEPVVVQDGRDGAAAADLQPLERQGPGRAPRRPHGLRGLAAPLGRPRAERARAAPGRQPRRHGLPGLRGRRGTAREADAGADHLGPRGLRRGGRDRGRRLRPPRLGEPAAPAPLAPPDHRRGGRPLPLAVGSSRTVACSCRGGRPTGRGPSASTGSIPRPAAREKAFDDPAWHDVQAKLVAPRPVPDARSSVVRDDDPEGKLFAVDVNLHDLGAKLPKGVAKRLRVVEGVAGHRGEAGRPASPRRDPARRGRLVPGAGAGQHARAAAARGRGRPRAAQLRLGLGAQSRGPGLRGLPRGPGADPAQPLHAGPAGAGPRAQPAPGEAPHGELRRRRAAARRVEVPVLPRGREQGAQARRARRAPSLGEDGRGTAQPARLAPARPGDGAAVGPGGRAPPSRSPCRPAGKRSPPTTSGPSSSGSTSEDSHEPHPRSRRPPPRGEPRAGPGPRGRSTRPEAADLHRGDGHGPASPGSAASATATSATSWRGRAPGPASSTTTATASSTSTSRTGAGSGR